MTGHAAFEMHEIVELIREVEPAELANLTAARTGDHLLCRTGIVFPSKVIGTALRLARSGVVVPKPFDLNKTAKTLYEFFDRIDAEGDRELFGGVGFRLRGWRGNRVMTLTDSKIVGIVERVLKLRIAEDTAADVRRRVWGDWMSHLAASGTTNAPRPAGTKGAVPSENDRDAKTESINENALNQAVRRHPAGGVR